MTSTPNISSQLDPLKALHESKLQIRRELNDSKAKLKGKVQEFIAPASDAHKKTTSISRLVSSGIAIYEGIRLGVSVIFAFQSLFGRKRRRRF